MSFLGVLVVMTQSTSTGVVYLLVFLAMFLMTYTLPAILLHPGTSKIFGAEIPIDKTNKFFYSISIGFNGFFATLGCIIIVYAFLQGMFAISFLGLLFLLLSYFNIKALKSRLQELVD